ncbi:MAG: amidophosphoribosyltransferase, partial [Candidatus Omnitrophica bacterium]|nr:amidophosphoribosyltransferase [Candidatus Omnitrophota bacterium]
IADGIENMFRQIEGSCSLLILHKDGIYAARDRRGYTPLVIGRKEGAWAVTSETTAFPNNHFKVVKYLAPGEIVLVGENGPVVRRKGASETQVCAFLWIYTGFPASDYEGINTEIVRERCGRALAKRDKDIDVDLVSGIPDSGLAHAIGYAMESKKPFRRPIVKYTPGYGRSYMPPDQSMRDLVATMKLIPIRELIEGNRIVVLEDSIVRGTQLKNYTINKLWECGAEEIHVRPACPPLMYPCKFCLSTRSVSELSARKAIKSIEGRDIEDVSEYIDHSTQKYQKMVDWIKRDIDVTTLRYQKIEDMVEAIGLPREKLCLYCWTGECPSGRKMPEAKPVSKKKRSRLKRREKDR